MDDTVWRTLCKFPPYCDRPPNPFASFQHYYRAAVAQIPDAIGDDLFGSIPPRVFQKGSILQRELTATGCLDSNLPVIRILRRTKVQILLLDRAERLFIGIASNRSPHLISQLQRAGSHYLFPTAFCLPGMVIDVELARRPSRRAPGSDVLVLRVTQTEHQYTTIEEEIDSVREDDSSWTFAVGFGCPGAGFSVLNFDCRSLSDGDDAVAA